MKLLIFIDSETGGAGKSTLAKLILEFFKIHEIDSDDYVLYDLDATKLDVGSVYDKERYCKKPDVKQEDWEASLLRFSDSDARSAEVDEVFEAALDKVVLVNLPSNIKHLFDSWIEQTNLLEVAKQNDIQIVKFFVCDGTAASVDLLIQTLDKYEEGEGINHVFVFNEKSSGLSYAKAAAEYSILEELPECYSIPLLIIPRTDKTLLDSIATKQLTFSEAIDSSSRFLKILKKQRIKTFIKVFEANFRKTIFSIGGAIATLDKDVRTPPTPRGNSSNSNSDEKAIL